MKNDKQLSYDFVHWEWCIYLRIMGHRKLPTLFFKPLIISMSIVCTEVNLAD